MAGPAALAVAIVILIGVGAFAEGTLRDALDTAVRVDHTRRVMADLAALDASLARTAENRRNFTLTGDEVYARNAFAELARVTSRMAELRALTSDNPLHQARLDRMAEILSGASARLTAAFETIRRQGFDLARESRIVRETRDRRESLLALADEMSGDELRLLAERQRATRSKILLARIVAPLGGAVSFALLWIAWRRLRKEVRMRLGSEQRARANEARLATTLQSIGDGVITTDAAGRVEPVSSAAAALTGYTRELTETNTRLHREIAERVQTEAALLRSEEQLRQSQKMESLGRLAGGVAHDFNNLLSVILGYVDLWESVPDAPHLAIEKEEIQEVRAAAQRAADLTRQLLAFSRQQVLEPVRLDLNERLGGLEKMLRRIIGEDVDLRFTAARGLSPVKVDPGQVEQVIINLVVNARDAMPGGGTLTIETADVELDEAYTREHLGMVAGSYVMVAVTDTGTGMDAPTQSRIFEPFYTTKGRGKGTGLGLSTVLGIVQQSGGSVWVYSEIGKGTTVKIYLPRDGGQQEITRPRLALPIPRGSETILLVEDEAAVRTVVRAILQRGGYSVVEARNGRDALAQLAESSRRIDLLLTDVVMPGMSGRELMEKATALRPDLRVLFMSGYTDDTVVHHGVLEAGVAFLQKPLTPERLSLKVREVLDEGSAPHVM